ncbi:amidohydrolase [Arthrobacter wenxiniae]|jgi:predicted amidohydrolase YtcJ|uniref:Amidohydrolase family protein n=1 Tax=Arthrobacter wenxiniae TaxID=2713570 RepID=A0A7Y7IIP0_9MICC|nr:amidohydrolase family protein [Arthrobacter wenxiniae]NVM96013.1 amidohydrolase family protein [Arthrobacter wenxiniae]
MSLTMYRNGSVYSAADPFATAMLVDGDTVAWVGSEHAASSLLDARMRLVDLDGTLITPGFVDSHVHVTETGLALDSVDLSGARSVAQALDLVAAAAAGGAGMVLGHGWDDSNWAEARPLSAAELDRAAGGREVYLARVDVHSGLVSPALARRCKLAGLSGWDGGALVSGDAHAAARDATRTLDDGARRLAQERALRHAAANGYVALAEMAAPHVGSPADLASLAALTAADAPAALPEVLPYWGQAVSGVEEARELLASLGTPVLGLAGDLNIDGSLGSRSALLREPYADLPAGAAGSHGRAYLDAGQVADHLAATSELGIPGGFHIIGDGAMAIACEGLVKAAERVGLDKVRAAGHRFEHAEMVDAGAMEVLARHAVTVSIQPAFDALWGGGAGMYARRLGAARAATLNPVAKFYAAGVPVCFGSDAPVTPLSPWASVRAALNHRQPGERISARAAFIGHTRAGWRAARGADPMLGQLAPGAPASFAVWEIDQLMVQVADERVQSWSTDPRAGTPLLPALDTGNDPRCLQTVHRGRELFAAPDFP